MFLTCSYVPGVRTDELDFELPERLIATTAAEPRDAARLMVCDRASGRVSHRTVADLPRLGVLRAGDLLVVNETSVLPARFAGVRSATGGRVTGLYLSHGPAGLWVAMLRSGGRPAAGEDVRVGRSLRLELLEALGGGRWRIRPRDAENRPLDPDASLAALREVGLPPLPPYLLRARGRAGGAADLPGDADRYQTVFADRRPEARRSVAAPTAGLHLTPGLLAALRSAGVHTAAVTLEVGPGTFLPVKHDNLDDHPMHAERWRVSASTLAALARTRAAGGRMLAVGTTSVRTLESLPHPLTSPPPADGLAGETDLFIRPGTGFTFRHTDLLLTNFHLPRSTLLALVAALPGVGLERLLGWYREAVAEEYRFYSFGDAMIVV